ncbi:MAG TPA: ABATE domain-containing protein [Gemmatimonadales bacterium]|nr:ABATE domain-containing protein [Gemmatimonadales bacterium]
MASPAFLLLGEALWLDLANTVPPPAARDLRPDVLTASGAVGEFLVAIGLPPLGTPNGAAALLELRRELIHLGDALATGERAPSSAITAINSLLTSHPGREQLVRVSGSWRLDFVAAHAPGALEALARSAAETLADPLAQVRRCIDPSCRRLLVDRSPGHSRTWCRERCRAVAGIERRRGSRTVPTV